jgi:hypothetical protein
MLKLLTTSVRALTTSTIRTQSTTIAHTSLPLSTLLTNAAPGEKEGKRDGRMERKEGNERNEGKKEKGKGEKNDGKERKKEEGW